MILLCELLNNYKQWPYAFPTRVHTGLLAILSTNRLPHPKPSIILDTMEFCSSSFLP